MKSAYELAMERLAKSEPASAPLSAEKKGRLAEIDRVYQGRIAEREIFLKRQLETALADQKADEAEKVRQQLSSERARLEEEREAEKERVRRGRRGLPASRRQSAQRRLAPPARTPHERRGPMRSTLLACLVLLFAGSLRAANRPNIILILADDLGYETLGVNGGESYRTPVLDRLAREGVRFTQAYAQPLCTPTRVQLMTGQYNVRNYINFGTMDPDATTFAQHFRRAGYRTAMAGKWQLGADRALPDRFGFEEHCLWQLTRRPPRYANPGLEYNGVERDFNRGEYGPDLVHDFVADFITRHQAEPFLMYYTMMLTHDPYQPTPDSADWDPKAIGEQVNRHPRHFGEMVAYMDKLVGRLVAQLEALKLREKTLILFIGDNGTGRGTVSRFQGRDYVGAKGSTNEAGMHVPLIASWPGAIAAGRVVDDLVDTTDFLPTLCAAAGLAVPARPELDGRSFWPQLRGERGEPRSWLYSWYSPRQNADLSAREFAYTARHKLYRTGEFYDLASDPLEKQPLAVANLNPEQANAARELRAALARFEHVRTARFDELARGNLAAKKAKAP